MPAQPEEPAEPSAEVTQGATEHYDAAVVARARAVLYEPPEVIGPYRIFERIGGGGMGDVYRAEQREGVRRPVAIKLIRPGFDTRQVVTRFEAERQALAMMHHPHIAQVYAAGNDETGRPYFVMEYVPGKPVTQFADENKLTVRQRLELFLQICSAITHAHTKLIIHRDIKSSNVLAYFDDEKQPVVKVIDFGVAKALSGKPLSDATLYTAHGEVLGTYDSMSPEQAAGSSDIDTRTDVYSLGVLLYELLAGTKPFDYKQVADHEIRRMIREVEPPPPSTRLSSLGEAGSQIAAARRSQLDTLTKELGGELEWIPLMAMRKERDRRYESPAALAADVERYIAGEPLEAGPESLTYRARKFIHKNRGVMTAIGAIIAALTLGIVGTTTMGVWYRAASAREAARANSETKAREAAEFESYVANIGAAQSAIASDNYAEARERLDSCTESKRGWEWKFLQRRAENIVDTIPTNCSVVGFTHDGTQMAVRDYGTNSVQWWDVTGRPVGEPISTNDAEIWAKLASDENRLVTASPNCEIGLWDRSGQPIHPLVKTEEKWDSVEFSDDGTTLLGKMAKSVISTWDALGKRLGGPLTIDEVGDCSAYFTGDGNHVYTISERTNDVSSYRVWDTALKPMGPPIESRKSVRVSFSRDGSRLISFDEDHSDVRLLGSNGKEISKLGSGNEQWTSAGFNSQSALILTNSHRIACLWDLDGRLVGEPMRFSHLDWIEFSPDGKRMASRDGATELVQLWDDRARLIASLPAGGYSFVFSANGQRLVTWSDNCIRIWDANSGRPICEPFENPCDSEIGQNFEFSPDGSRLLVVESSNNGLAWRMWLFEDSGRSLGCWYDGKVFVSNRNGGTSKLLSPDGRHVLIEREDGNSLIVSTDNFSPPMEYIDDDLEYKWPSTSVQQSAETKSGSNRKRDELKKNISDLRAAAPKIANWAESKDRKISLLATDNRDARILTSGGEADPTIRFWDSTIQRQVCSFPVVSMYFDSSKTIHADGTTSSDDSYIRPVRSGVKSLELSDGDQRVIFTACDVWSDWHTEIWDVRDPKTRQQDRDARWNELVGYKKWAKHRLQESISRLRDQAKNHQVTPSWQAILDRGFPPFSVELAVFQEDETIKPLQRRAIFDAALELADDLEAENMAVWAVVADQASSGDQLSSALQHATELCDRLPSATRLRLLAVALFRNGKFSEAADIFQRREDMLTENHDLIFDQHYDDDYALAGHVFRAMAVYKAGNQQSARKMLEVAESNRKIRGLKHEEQGLLFDEAEALIGKAEAKSQSAEAKPVEAP